MNEKITTSQIRHIRWLMRQYAACRGYDMEDSEKQQLVLEHSQHRTTHISELTAQEGRKLATSLLITLELFKQFREASRMKRKIFYYARQMGWLNGNEVDYKRIDEWCKKYGYLHKRLNQYAASELPRLVTQFEQVYRDFMKKLSQ